MSTPSDLYQTIGALEIGVWVSTFLYGCQTVRRYASRVHPITNYNENPVPNIFLFHAEVDERPVRHEVGGTFYFIAHAPRKPHSYHL